MKNIFFFAQFLVLFVFITSCVKEIDLKYKHDFDRLVVEAILVKGDVTHQIRVSREVDYFDFPDFMAAENLVITLEDESGNKGVFQYIDSGYYELNNYSINYRTTYNLHIKDGNKTVKATSKTSSEIKLDTILIDTYVVNGWTYGGVIPVFTDPAGEKNYYTVVVHPSSIYINQFYTKIQSFTDELIDGKNNTNSIFCPYNSGDTLTFTLCSIDNNRYQYIQTLGYSYYDGGFFSASPSNPISNFKDDALGYFSVEVRDSMTMIFP